MSWLRRHALQRAAALLVVLAVSPFRSSRVATITVSTARARAVTDARRLAATVHAAGPAGATVTGSDTGGDGRRPGAAVARPWQHACLGSHAARGPPAVLRTLSRSAAVAFPALPDLRHCTAPAWPWCSRIRRSECDSHPRARLLGVGLIALWLTPARAEEPSTEELQRELKAMKAQLEQLQQKMKKQEEVIKKLSKPKAAPPRRRRRPPRRRRRRPRRS